MTPLTPETAKGATIVAFTDILEFACVYIAYKMTDCALLQPIRFTRIFIAIFLSYILLNEKITSMQIIATTIIVMANMASILYSRKKQD
jgi:drug/metabolite transporter (DMT)-like permease